MKEETCTSGRNQPRNVKDPAQNENRGPLVQKHKNFQMAATEDQSGPGPSERSSSPTPAGSPVPHVAFL